jgi:uncharacterized protein YegP (UPF0339 family)
MNFNIKMLAVFAALSLSAVACAAPEADADEVESTASEISSSSARFETFKGVDGQHYFDLIAGNGENVLRSEGYTSKSAAEKGVQAVVNAGVSSKNFVVLAAKNGEYYFNLKAANGEIVGTSELYSTKSNATRASRTVRALILKTGISPTVQVAPARERFEVFVGEDSQTYFRVRAGNGEIMLGSEGYTSKAGALAGIESVKVNGRAGNFEVFEAASGEFGIRLVAGNSQTIGRGELYSTKSNADRAVARLTAILSSNLSTQLPE